MAGLEHDKSIRNEGKLVMRRLTIALFVVAMALMVVPVFAQVRQVVVMTNVNLNLRATASTRAAILAVVPYNTQLPATAISSDRNWVIVTYNDQTGWMSLAYTRVLTGQLGWLPTSHQSFDSSGEDIGENLADNAHPAPILIDVGGQMLRSNAVGRSTVWLHVGEALSQQFTVEHEGLWLVVLRYSNDNWPPPGETVEVRVDDVAVGEMSALDTGDGGYGWNVFVESEIDAVYLTEGQHTIEVEAIRLGDRYGIEIDTIQLLPQ